MKPIATAASAALPPKDSTSRPRSAALGSSAATPPMKPVSRFCSACPAVLTPPPKNVFLSEDTLEQPVMASAPANDTTARKRAACGLTARSRAFGFETLLTWHSPSAANRRARPGPIQVTPIAAPAITAFATPGNRRCPEYARCEHAR